MEYKISFTNIHHFLKAVILIGLSIYILLLTFTGDILQFIIPELVIYVKIAAIFLMIVAGFQFYISFLSLKKQVIVCSCGHDHDHSHNHVFDHEHHAHDPKSLSKNIFIYGLFLLPLILGFSLPNHTSTNSLVANRGMNLGGLANKGTVTGDAIVLDGNEDPALKEKFKTNVYNRDYAKLGMILYKQSVIEMTDKWFIEKLQSLNTFVDTFQTKKIKIKGFIYREPGLQGNQFIIARMGMTHCINDISPFGIIAESATPGQFTNDSWVTITGTIGKTNYKGVPVIKITVESSEPANAPKVPYVYPDWNFGSKL